MAERTPNVLIGTEGGDPASEAPLSRIPLYPGDPSVRGIDDLDDLAGPGSNRLKEKGYDDQGRSVADIMEQVALIQASWATRRK